MNNEILLAIKRLLEQLVAKPDGAVVAACVTVGGMLGVALLTAAVQWIVTRTVVRSEHHRLETQLTSEFRLRQFESWQNRFQDTVADLLAALDPEANVTINPEKVVPLIHKAQLMLNLDLESHRNINSLIIQLGLATNGWTPGHQVSDLLRLHGDLLDAVRKALYLPGKKL